VLNMHHYSQLDPRTRCESSIIISLYIYYDMHAQIIFIILKGCNNNVTKKDKAFDLVNPQLICEV